MDKQAKTVVTTSILKQTYAIDATKKEINTRKETIADVVESNQAWLDLQAAKEETKRLTEQLAHILANDGNYNNQLEDLAQLKDKLKSQKETLSDLIVGYRLETGESQIETSRNGDAQQLVITGKLGKKGKYQTNLFAGEAA